MSLYLISAATHKNLYVVHNYMVVSQCCLGHCNFRARVAAYRYDIFDCVLGLKAREGHKSTKMLTMSLSR